MNMDELVYLIVLKVLQIYMKLNGRNKWKRNC